MHICKLLADTLNIPKAVRTSLHPLQIRKFRGIYFKLKLNKCGWGTTIDKFVTIKFGKNLSIGEYCSLNSFIHIWAGKAGVKIGDRVMIASHVAISSLTHNYETDNMCFAPAIDKPITINDDVWIGAHSIIMPGVTLGKGAVIGAGSVVTRNIPEYAVAMGVPAKVIKFRFSTNLSNIREE